MFVSKLFRHLALCLLAFASQTVLAHSYSEERALLFNGTQLLKPGESFQCRLTLPKTDDVPQRKILHVTGLVPIPKPYDRRGEGNLRAWIYNIDDHLIPAASGGAPYRLLFRGTGDSLEHRAYYRVLGENLKPGKATLSIPVTRKNLRISGEGEFLLRLELFKASPHRHARDIHDKADDVIELSIPAAEFDGEELLLSKEVDIPEDVATCLLSIGGGSFSGDCVAGPVRIAQGGQSVQDLSYRKNGEEEDRWVGVNLCSRAYPEFELKLDGKTVFAEAVFDRASNVADFYVPLPPDAKDGAELSLTLKNEAGPQRFPYEIRQLALLSQSARDFELVALPQYVRAGANFGLLVETNRDDVTLRLSADPAIQPLEEVVQLAKAGLHAVSFKAIAPAFEPTITLKDGSREETAMLGSVILKEDDAIYLSSGDEIHIDKKYKPYDQFFKWYVGTEVGNMYQFRPSYQWSGVRGCDDDFYRHYTGLLTDLNMPYAFQVEGRTIPGADLNPDVSVLAGPLFKGKQAHENDGAFSYWNHIGWEGLYSDLFARYIHKGGIFPKVRPIRKADGSISMFFDRQKVNNMKEGAEYIVSNFAQARGQSTRHTGPSVMFRYLLQAGYEWVGAEQMYGPEEVMMSALRGASHAYGKSEYGSLHATQWGSAPFDDARHATRLFNSLAVSYLHGSTNINTEEGIWTDEFANNRFTEAGKDHHAMQTDILNFIRTHERGENMVRDMAFIQGRNDGWRMFSAGGSIWGQQGKEWAPGAAEASYDLLHVFYPQNRLDAVIHCGQPETPQGWHSSTPYGAADLLPIEASAEALSQYKTLVFTGWNTFEVADFERLEKWVQAGGTLVLSRAHLNTSLKHNAPTLTAASPVLARLLGDDYATATGFVQRSVGQGRVLFFASDSYPSEDSLKAAYRDSVQALAETHKQEQIAKGWVEPGENIGFTCWESEGKRVLYLLNIDWWSKADSHSATLRLGDWSKEIAVARRSILPVTVLDGRILVIPAQMNTHVIGLKEGKLLVQTQGADVLTLIVDGEERQIPLDAGGLHELSL